MEMTNSMKPAISIRELQARAAIICMKARLYIQSGAVITRSNMHITAVTETEYKSEFEYTKYTLYLAGVFCEDFGEIWPRYNGIALSIVGQNKKLLMTLF